jgi:hypothetical protein
MKCPACYQRFCESETARYCSSCGYMEYYWGRIQPTDESIKRIVYEKWQRYLDQKKQNEADIETNNNNRTNDELGQA